MSMSYFVFLIAQTGSPSESSSSLLKTIQAGGVIGWVIIGLSVIALTMIIMHMVQIRRRVLVPPQHVEAVDALLARNDVVGALEYTLKPEHDSYLTRILAAGLTRYQRSAFGAFEIKTTIEEAGEEQTARLYRSTDVLSVIGSIAPLLGLLGTVLGIYGAFETLGAGARPDHTALASKISLALVTTLLGLIVAIPCMALFAYFRNRIDALAAEAALEIERLLLHLESPAVLRSPAEARPGPTFVPRGAAPSTVPPAITAPKNA